MEKSIHETSIDEVNKQNKNKIFGFNGNSLNRI